MSSAPITAVIFNKSLSTMVKGIRGHKDKGQADYIAKCLAEIKVELQQSYGDVKANALKKLVYLHMSGYDMGWAAFHVIEVMSQSWFGDKRVGYLAANVSFTQSTDVVLLTTHLFRKAFTGGTSSGTLQTDTMQFETGAALNCLANIVTAGLAQDLLSDLYGMMNSSRPYIRKKATLVLLSIFKQWPKALRLSFDRLKERLADENQGVVSAAVYVICELSAKNPHNYLSLAPQFFKILTSSSNNWVLIKVVKLLGSLVPLEPRLAKKLIEPLTDIITTTPAKSLLYECVNTLLCCDKLSSKTTVRLCLDKLRSFIEDPDQNLKYLGLLGLHKLMQKEPRVVGEHKDLILGCLKDEDVTIRMRALDLVTAMVSKRNLVGIVRRLVDHLDFSDGAYRETVLGRIIFICQQDSFAYISDFEWYISMLVSLTHLNGASADNAQLVTDQLMAVIIRVPAVRPFAVEALTDLLLDQRLLGDSVAFQSNKMFKVLTAAAFGLGEFSNTLEQHLHVIEALLKPHVASSELAPSFVHAAFKVFCAVLQLPYAPPGQAPEKKDNDADESEEETKEEEDEEVDEDSRTTKKKRKRRSNQSLPYTEWEALVKACMSAISTLMPAFTLSSLVEVQERAVAYLEFNNWLTSADFFSLPAVDYQEKQTQMSYVIAACASLFAEPMNPVHPEAQGKVQLPEGLDLDKQINEPDPDSESEKESDKEEPEETGSRHSYRYDNNNEEEEERRKKPSKEDRKAAKKRRQLEEERRKNDPYYIPNSEPKKKVVDVDDIPVRMLGDDMPSLKVTKEKKAKERRRRSSLDDEVVRDQNYAVLAVQDLPPGATLDAPQVKKAKDGLDMDLDTPLGADEVIPRVQNYADQRHAHANMLGKAERKSEHRDKKEKKKKKDKERESEVKEKGSEKESKEKEKKSKSRTKEETPAPVEPPVDIFDPLAAAPPPSSAPAASSPSSPPAAETKEAPNSIIYQDQLLSLSASFAFKSADPKLALLLTVSLQGSSKVGPVSLSFPESPVVRFSDAKQKSKLEWSKKGSELTGIAQKLSSRHPLSGVVKVEWRQAATKTEPVPLQISLTLQTEKEKKICPIEVPWSALVRPKEMNLEALGAIMTGSECSCLASAKIALSGISVAEALRAVCQILNVALVEAVNYNATYAGTLQVDQSPVAVLVKAKKDDPVNVVVEVKSSANPVSQGLLAELTRRFSSSVALHVGST